MFIFKFYMKVSFLNLNNSYTFNKSRKINSLSQNSLTSDVFQRNNNLTFCARKICDVNLISRKGKKPLPAQICELNHSQCDSNLLLNLNSYWRDTAYTSDIVDDFYSGYKSKYFAVALGDSVNVKPDDIKSIVEFDVIYDKDDDEGYCYINFLQSAPEIADNKRSPIKGAGALALYAVVDYAKRNNFRKVSLFSSNNAFYEKMGFENDGRACKHLNNCDFHLDRRDFDWFLNEIRKKYGF